jgi:mannose-6-phosphate isomerase
MEPKIVKKPWGREEIWGDLHGKYLGKTLHIDMKNRLSKQYHEKKEETIYVIRGVLTVEIDDAHSGVEKVFGLGPGQCYHIPPKTIHRFCAYSGDVVLAEVSTYFPDDVVRLEDDYNR